MEAFGRGRNTEKQAKRDPSGPDTVRISEVLCKTRCLIYLRSSMSSPNRLPSNASLSSRATTTCCISSFTTHSCKIWRSKSSSLGPFRRVVLGPSSPLSASVPFWIKAFSNVFRFGHSSDDSGMKTALAPSTTVWPSFSKKRSWDAMLGPAMIKPAGIRSSSIASSMMQNRAMSSTAFSTDSSRTIYDY